MTEQGRQADSLHKDTKRLLRLVLEMARNDPMLFCLTVGKWARRQPRQVVQSLAEATLEGKLSEALEGISRARREGDFRKRRLLVWIEGLANANPELFRNAGLQYVQNLPLQHLLPFAQFLAAAEGVEKLLRELAGGERNGQPQ